MWKNSCFVLFFSWLVISALFTLSTGKAYADDSSTSGKKDKPMSAGQSSISNMAGDSFAPGNYIELRECKQDGECEKIYPGEKTKKSFMVDKNSIIRVEFLRDKIKERKIYGELFVSASVLSPTSALLPVSNYVKQGENKAYEQEGFEIQDKDKILKVQKSFFKVNNNCDKVMPRIGSAFESIKGTYSKEDGEGINKSYLKVFKAKKPPLIWNSDTNRYKQDATIGIPRELTIATAHYMREMLTPLLDESANLLKEYKDALNEITSTEDIILLSSKDIAVSNALSEVRFYENDISQITNAISGFNFAVNEKGNEDAVTKDYEKSSDAFELLKNKIDSVCQRNVNLKAYELLEKTSKDELEKSLQLLPHAEVDFETAKLDSGYKVELMVTNKIPGDKGKDKSNENSDSKKDNYKSLEERFVLETLDLGFAWSVSPSVGFVKRIRDAGISNSTDRIVASNFKPAAGANLKLRYNWKNKTRNFFVPSALINISMLDFVDDNLEIGVGAGIGWLNDMVGIGYGYNLHAPDDYHGYLFVNINFIEGIDTFKSIFAQ